MKKKVGGKLRKNFKLADDHTVSFALSVPHAGPAQKKRALNVCGKP